MFVEILPKKIKYNVEFYHFWRLSAEWQGYEKILLLLDAVYWWKTLFQTTEILGEKVQLSAFISWTISDACLSISLTWLKVMKSTKKWVFCWAFKSFAQSVWKNFRIIFLFLKKNLCQNFFLYCHHSVAILLFFYFLWPILSKNNWLRKKTCRDMNQIEKKIFFFLSTKRTKGSFKYLQYKFFYSGCWHYGKYEKEFLK